MKSSLDPLLPLISDPLAIDAQNKLLIYRKQLSEGNLSQPEYEDLCQDLFNMEHIKHDITDLNRVTLIQQEFDCIMKFYSVLSSVL